MGRKSYCFWPEKVLKLSILARKSLRISAKTVFFFFFGDHLFLAGKSASIFDFGQKKPWDFGEDLLFFIFLEITEFSLKNGLNPNQEQ